MADGAGLRLSAFRGDEDIEALDAFFQPQRQFSGNTLWSFGTSLKSAFVNSFEFMNQAPVVQLWRDAAGGVQAVSRLSLGDGAWFHLAAPGYRSEDVAIALVEQADAAIALLTEHEAWQTVRYGSALEEIRWLEQSGYRFCGTAEVYMTRPLTSSVDSVPLPSDIDIKLLDPTDPAMVDERAMAQVHAFTAGIPTPAEMARSLPHQLGYGQRDHSFSVIAVADDGEVVSFADPFLDRVNKIGEFEPVGTRKSAQKRGLGKAVLVRGLQEMRDRGMTLAVVRTGADNHAAIAAYESVGFEVTDHLARYRKTRASFDRTP